MRSVEDVDMAIAAVRARRALKVNEHDRQERNMLAALRETERLEKQIANDDATIDGLLDERMLAVDAEIVEALR